MTTSMMMATTVMRVVLLFIIVVGMSMIFPIRMIMPAVVIVHVSAETCGPSSGAHLSVVFTPAIMPSGH